MKKITAVILMLAICAAALALCGRSDARDTGIRIVSATQAPMRWGGNPYAGKTDYDAPDIVELPFHLKFKLYKTCHCDVPLDELKTPEDLERVTRLVISFEDAHDYQPFSIESLKQFPNLKSLGLSDIPVTELEAISDLQKLEILTLYNCELLDIAPVATLKNLNYLDLSYNRITDASALTNLKKLKTLRLDHTKLASLEQISGLDALETLNVDYTYITDFAPLKDLKNLKTLYARGIAMRYPEVKFTFSGLEELTQLESLDISGNELTSLDCIRNLTNLRDLSVYNNWIRSLEPLNGYKQLGRLSIRDNPLGKLEGIEKLESLEILDISNCCIASLEPLAGLQRLRDLDVSNGIFVDITSNRIRDYSPVLELESLEKMRISREDFHWFASLAGKTDVKLAYSEEFFGDYRSIEERLAEAEEAKGDC